jgi:hypothetical protein
MPNYFPEDKPLCGYPKGNVQAPELGEISH